MFRLEGGRPNDERGFIHKSKFGKFIGGAVKQIVPIVGPATQAISFAKQVFAKQPARRIAPRSTTARPTVQGQQGKALGRSFKFGVNGAVHPAVAPGALVRTAAAPCFPGFTRDPRSGRCTPIAVTLARKVGEIIVGGGGGRFGGNGSGERAAGACRRSVDGALRSGARAREHDHRSGRVPAGDAARQ